MNLEGHGSKMALPSISEGREVAATSPRDSIGDVSGCSEASAQSNEHNGRRKKNRKRFRGSVALSHISSSEEHDTRRASFTSTRELQEIEKLLAADIATCISNQSQTTALIAALLSTWAVTVYGGERPVDDGLCFGETMVSATYVVFWISLGFFFVCVSSSLAIIADLDGVPQKHLYRHLKQKVVRLTYQIPEFTMILGVICLALGYAMDVGERAGCAFFYFGCVASFSFVVIVSLLFWVLKQARKQLHEETVSSHSQSDMGAKPPRGKYFIATWRDRLDYCIDEIRNTSQNNMGSRILSTRTMNIAAAAASVTAATAAVE